MIDEVARRTGLRPAWVRHHVLDLVGRPCARCGDARTCRRCSERPRLNEVEALAWVEANVDRVRLLGERRDERAAHKRHRDAQAVVAWKIEHAEEWAFLEDMLPCDFKYSVIAAIEERRVSPGQVEALQKLVATSRRIVAPIARSEIRVRVTVTGARIWFTQRGRRVFRIDFRVAAGWAGRVETTDDKLIAAVQSRKTDEALLTGIVSWSQESYAILSDSVSMDFTPR